MLFLIFLGGCFSTKLNYADKWPGSGRREMSNAISENDANKISFLLSPGWMPFSSPKVHVDELDENGWAPIHEAAYLGKDLALEMLVEQGAQLDILTGKGEREELSNFTPLMLAVFSGQCETCKVLLTRIKNVDAEDLHGPLMLSIEGGRKEICELLLGIAEGIKQNQASGMASLVNKRSLQGKTALMLAAERGNSEICELLLSRGKADVHIKINNATALDWAALGGHVEVCELISRQISLAFERSKIKYEIAESIEKALIIAASHGHEKVFDRLYLTNLDLNLKRRHRAWEALMLAAEKGQATACRILLKYGFSNINLQMTDGRTPLIMASAKGHFDVCELLLEDDNCKLEIRSAGRTALMHAAENGHVKICELLLNKGADVNARNRDTWTALTFAIYYGREAVFKLLIDESGDKLDKHSFSAFRVLAGEPMPVGKPRMLIVEDIVTRRMFDKFFQGCYEEACRFLSPEFLIENFNEISKRNAKGFNGLHFASMGESGKDLKFVLGYSLVLDFIDSADNADAISPLRLAIKYKRMGNAAILLAHGASPIFKRPVWSDTNFLKEHPALQAFLQEKALLLLLKLGRVELAKRLITYSFSGISYADIIDLRVRDERGMNVYHYLASYCHENIALQEFLNRSVSLKSFDRFLLNQYDNEGLTPLHTAVVASNFYFIEHIVSSKLLDKNELNIRTKGKELSVIELVLHGLVDKETVDAIAKYVIVSDASDDQSLSEILSGQDMGLKMQELGLFLRNGGNINQKLDGGYSVIEHIIARDDCELLVYLGREETEMNSANLFLLALNFSSEKILSLLCDRFAEYESIKGKDPVISQVIEKVNFHDLCSEGKEASVKAVLRFRTDGLGSLNKKGELPLHVAAEKGRVEIVKLLLDQKEVVSRINSVNNKEQNVIHSAVLGFSPQIISMLFEKGCSGVADRDVNGNRPIDIVADLTPRDQEEESKRIGVMYALLCVADGIEYDPNEYESAINLAIKHNEVKIVKELLKGGLCNYRDKEGNNPLHIAVAYDKKEVVLPVLSFAKDFAVKNFQRQTPLHLVKSVEILSEYFDAAIEMDVDSTSLLNEYADNNGELPLHSVIRRANDMGTAKAASLLRYMLDNGADRQKKGRDGSNPEELAINLELDNLAVLVRTYEADLSVMTRRRQRREAELASEQLRREARDVSRILNGEMGVDEPLSGKARRAIHYAIDNGDNAKMERLLELGANPMIEDKKGNTAYRLAASVSAEVFANLLAKTDFEDMLKPDSNGEIIIHIGLRKGAEFEKTVLKGLKVTDEKVPGLFFIAIDYRRERAIEEFFKLGFDVKEAKDNQGKTVLKYIIDSTGKAEAKGLEEKDKLQRCFRCVLAEIKRSEDLVSVLFSADNAGRTAMAEALSVSDSFYLLEILKRARAVLEEDEERTITKETFYRKLNSEIEGKIAELMGRPEHMMVLLDSHSGMSNILVQGEESTFGKAIYLAAERKNEDAVKSMIASYVSFKSRRDIVYDKARGYIPMIVQPICVALGMGSVGKVLDSVLSSRSEDEYEAIRFVDEVYREGEWALDVEVIPVNDLLRYYKKAVKNLREMSREEVERKLAKSQEGGARDTSRSKRAVKLIKASARKAKIAVKRAIKRELERSGGSLLDVMFEVGEPVILEEALRELYMNKKELMKDGILNSLEFYTTHHKEYEAFVLENIRPVLKEKKEWNSEFGTELKRLYKELMSARRILRDKIYDYLEYLACGFKTLKLEEDNVSFASAMSKEEFFDCEDSVV